MTEFLITAEGRRLAFNRHRGKGPGVVFLGGYASDMEGTKARFLESWARERGRAFLRFDYSGHGASSGDFAEGCIGDWAEDARAAIAALTEGPQVLVGSSMGGWIALLMARAMPRRLAGLVGIAAAPDFTETMWEEDLTPAERAEIAAQGRIARPSPHGEAPGIFTRRLFEDGARQCVLKSPLALPFPARFLQGTADAEVPVRSALRILDHAAGPDMRLTLVRGADHRFSTPDLLELIGATVAEVLERAGDRGADAT